MFFLFFLSKKKKNLLTSMRLRDVMVGSGFGWIIIIFLSQSDLFCLKVDLIFFDLIRPSV
jgi:hypothetical protein